MGSTKQYLRFIPSGKFNIITSSNSNVSFAKHKDKDNRYAVVGAAENVIVWDTRLAKKVLEIEGEKYEAVYTKCCFETQHLAVGYKDGTVVLYDLTTSAQISTFSGHRSSITTVAFDCEGHRIVTGSKDSDVVVWDVVAEQGLFRLSGHKGPVTQVQFMKTRNIIVSSSKDTFIKFWDLTNGHCFKTLTGHVAEVWAFCILKNDSYLVTGTNDSELRVWQITDNDEKHHENFDVEYMSPIRCEKIGSVLRQGFGRVVSMSADSSDQVFCVHGNEKLFEVFYFVTEEEAIRRRNRKLKKRRKKLENSTENKDYDLPPHTSLIFSVARLYAVKTEAKIKSADISFNQENKIKVIISLNNNSLELYNLSIEKDKEAVLSKQITHAGHNSDVRAVAFAYDNIGIVSGSATSLKLWNRTTLSCLRTVDTDYVLSVCFVPSDRYVLVGTKNGSLLIVDIVSGDILETIEAHTKEVWSLSVLPNKLGCISAGGDCTVKFWNFELLKEQATSSALSLVHMKTLKLDDPVLHVRVTPDSNLVAAALLDSTVKIFFMDSLKFFLSLYGHKLPVTCLDVSHDSTLIATASADRNVKIWGLDYGDCHKSIFAHDDTVTSLCFVPNTHYFFTCGKDGAIKQWDADSFQRILTLPAHHGEAWSLAVSPNGSYLISCGQDRVLRLYEKTLEPLVLEDERETEREKEEEETLATGTESVLHGRGTLQLTSKKTVNAEKGAELLLECVDVLNNYKKDVLEAKRTGSAPPSIPTIMIAFNAKNGTEYFLAVIRKIRTSDLEEILSLLSLSNVTELLEYLLPVLKTNHRETETVIRILLFLIQVHNKPIVSSRNIYLNLQKVRSLTFERIKELRDTVGYNLHILMYIQRMNKIIR